MGGRNYSLAAGVARAARGFIALVALIIGIGLRAAPVSQGIDSSDVFVSGTGGYHTYRIPALVTSKKGTVLAFCEGRRNSASDSGEIDLLLRRSEDGGRTWAPVQIVWAEGKNVCGNPTPVLDRSTGDIWLLLTWNRGEDSEREIQAGIGRDTRRVFLTRSRDEGVSWLEPVDITAAIKLKNWRWYATGPGNGIQMTRGPHRGRLVVPANHSDHSDPSSHPFRAHVIYSDDHGQTWQLGGVEEEKTNESTLVERVDGSLLHNMRSYHGKHCRAIATSGDGGLTWSKLSFDAALIEPVCQASLLRYAWPTKQKPGIVLFSNPASLKRENLTVRVSYDDGVSWPLSRTLQAGPAAYSCLAALPDQIIGCLYECGEKNAYEKIVLTRFSMSSLTEHR